MHVRYMYETPTNTDQHKRFSGIFKDWMIHYNDPHRFFSFRDFDDKSNRSLNLSAEVTIGRHNYHKSTSDQHLSTNNEDGNENIARWRRCPTHLLFVVSWENSTNYL